MKSLFLKSLSRLTSQLNLQKTNKLTVEDITKSIINKYTKTLKAKDMERLPNKSLRTMLKIPCPSSQISKQEIEIFKRLRLTYSIEQSSVCQKCPRAGQCSFKDKLPEEKYQSKLQHLIFFMTQMGGRHEDSFSQLRWDAAFRLSESCRMFIRDMSNLQGLKTQSKIYNETYHWQQQVNKKQKQRKQFGHKNTDQIYKNRKFKISPVSK